MTFYNIIFGLLFIGAFREVIFYSLGTWNPARFCMAASLSVLIFSDTIYTSVVIEGMKRRYRMRLKLLDLLSFLLLSVAVVILNPSKNDMFEVDAQARLCEILHDFPRITEESVFWAILAIYMFNLAIWNLVLSSEARLRWTDAVQPMLALVFAALAWWTARVQASNALGLHWTVLVLVIAYLLLFKTYFVHQLEPCFSLEKVDDTRFSVFRVPTEHGKSDLPEKLSGLKYALLHQSRLAGCVTLTETGETVEMYVWLRPALRGRRYGRRAIKAAVHHGFFQLKASRIVAAVGLCDVSAKRALLSCGFKICPDSSSSNGDNQKFQMELKKRPWLWLGWQYYQHFIHSKPLKEIASSPVRDQYRQAGCMTLFLEAGVTQHIKFPLTYDHTPNLWPESTDSLTIEGLSPDGFMVRSQVARRLEFRWSALGTLASRPVHPAAGS